MLENAKDFLNRLGPLNETLWGLPIWVVLVSAIAVGLLTVVFKLVLRSILGKLAINSGLASKPLKYLELIIKSISTFTLIVLSINIVLKFFNVPPQAASVVAKLTTIVLFLQVGQVLEIVLNPAIGKWLEGATNVPRSAHTLVFFVTRFVIWIVICLLLLDNLGINVSALIAGLGVGGLAVALAVQNILGDLFCSLSIVLDRPFEVGDFIVVGDLKGEVERIGIKSTRIRSLSGEQIVISNSELTQGRIQNFKRMEQRRVAFKLGVTYQTPSEKLKQIPEMIKNAVDSIKDTRFDRAHFLEFGDSSLNFEVVFFVLKSDFNFYADIHHELNLKLYEKFETEGIEFAYPTRTIYNINE